MFYIKVLLRSSEICNVKHGAEISRCVNCDYYALKPSTHWYGQAEASKNDTGGIGGNLGTGGKGGC